MFVKSVLLCCLSLWAVVANAESVLDCRHAYSSEETTRCAELDRDVAELRMDKYLEVSRQLFAHDELVLFSIDNAQTHWIEYRRNHCDVVFDISGGTVRESNAMQCEAMIARERTHQLWRSYIAPLGGDSLLPEPALR